MKKVPRKKAKRTKPKHEPRLFLGYPDHVIMTGTFSSTDDSIDQENRTPPRAGDIVYLSVDDPGRDEEGGDLPFKVLAVNTEKNGGDTNLKLELHGDYRIAMSP
jgi:hypothetical protein